MGTYEVYHIGPHEETEFQRILKVGLKSLSFQAQDGYINLADVIQRRCIYWLDQETQKLRIHSLYFRPERPPNTCNFVGVHVPNKSLVLDNRRESYGFKEYMSSGMSLDEFFRKDPNPDYMGEIVLPNAPTITKFSSINFSLNKYPPLEEVVLTKRP